MSYALYIDIETLPRPRAELEALCPQFEAPGNLKDPVKIEAAIAAKREAFFDDGALDATTGTIAIIGMVNTGGDDTSPLLRADKMTEADMLTVFWGEVAKGYDSIVGHNLKKFDLPFIIRRSWMLGVKAFPHLLIDDRGYFRATVRDTMEAWGCGDRNTYFSLANLCRALGVPGKSGDGSQFAALWAESPDKAAAYCLQDIAATMACADRMGL